MRLAIEVAVLKRTLAPQSLPTPAEPTHRLADADVMRLVALAGWNVQQAEHIFAGNLAPLSLKGRCKRDHVRVFENALRLLLGGHRPELFRQTDALVLGFASSAASAQS